MGFINEYVSEEDIKEYKLDELWFKYNPGKKEVPSYFQHHWTVDRENNVFLKEVDGGREEHSNRVVFAFFIKGDLFEVVLDTVKGGSLDFSEQPYVRIWELIQITPTALVDKHKDLISLLKNALTSFAVSGVFTPVSNSIVKFNNF